MWSEHPPERPRIDDIREIMLKRISTSRSSNLMDYMFALMENNAAELEQDVQQRTLELLEEQKKADVLLYRMMPRWADIRSLRIRFRMKTKTGKHRHKVPNFVP